MESGEALALATAALQAHKPRAVGRRARAWAGSAEGQAGIGRVSLPGSRGAGRAAGSGSIEIGQRKGSGGRH